MNSYFRSALIGFNIDLIWNLILYKPFSVIIEHYLLFKFIILFSSSFKLHMTFFCCTFHIHLLINLFKFKLLCSFCTQGKGTLFRNIQKTGGWNYSALGSSIRFLAIGWVFMSIYSSLPGYTFLMYLLINLFKAVHFLYNFKITIKFE